MMRDLNDSNTPYEAPSVEEIETDGFPISTAPGSSLPVIN
jgi:hypothetical protein